MDYLIVADWDSDFRPTKVNRKDTLAGADALVDKLKNHLPEGKKKPNAFHVVNPDVSVKYITVDPISKTVTVDTVKRDADALANAWYALRGERNDKLNDTDSTQMSDRPNEGKLAWADYRQVLRDLPANTPDPTSPTWPTPPE